VIEMCTVIVISKPIEMSGKADLKRCQRISYLNRKIIPALGAARLNARRAITALVGGNCSHSEHDERIAAKEIRTGQPATSTCLIAGGDDLLALAERLTKYSVRLIRASQYYMNYSV